MRTTFKVLAVLVALGFSVDVKSQSVNIDMTEPMGDNFLESELFMEVSFVPLTVEKVSMISHDMEIKLAKNQYFVLDNKFRQCVYRFNSDGELMNTIGGDQSANAQNSNHPMLTNPVKFTVDPYRNQIELYSFEDSEIYRYKFDGQKAGHMDMKTNPSDFIRDVAGNYWVYMGWNNSSTPFRLMKADAGGKIGERFMRLITKCTPTEGFAFYDSGDGICLWELLGNKTYMIKNGAVKESFSFDYGSYSLPEKYHLLEPSVTLQEIMNKGYYTIKKYLENEHYTYFFLNFSSPTQKEMIHVIYDKRKGEYFKYNEFANIGAFDKAQALTENDELVFLVSARRMRQLLSSKDVLYVPSVFDELSEQVASIRYPILLKIKLGEVE